MNSTGGSPHQQLWPLLRKDHQKQWNPRPCGQGVPVESRISPGGGRLFSVIGLLRGPSGPRWPPLDEKCSSPGHSPEHLQQGTFLAQRTRAASRGEHTHLLLKRGTGPKHVQWNRVCGVHGLGFKSQHSHGACLSHIFRTPFFKSIEQG